MGCTQSADTRLQTVDDSVHVMLAHDKKRQQQKGEKPHGYVPRAEHPLLKPKAPVVTATEDDDTTPAAAATATATADNGATTTTTSSPPTKEDEKGPIPQ